MRIAKRVLALTLVVGSAVSCGDVSRDGQSPVYLILQSLEAKRGGGKESASNYLLSDVITNVTSPEPCTASSPCATVFNDVGTAVFSLALKDISNPASAPTSNNAVTLTRYHVAYHRADGRNTPGVDVPYPFDGAATITVPPAGTAAIGFEIVRHIAKEEAPLVQLQVNPTIITTIAEVTFYGTDRTGNDISAHGSMQIDFGNFGDQ